MGRKRKTLDQDQRAQVEALAAYLSQDQIADYFGITRPTFAAMIERDEDISLRYKKGKAKAIGAVAQGLLQKARGSTDAAGKWHPPDTTSAIFYLKTQAGWRETSVHEHTGADGGAIKTEDVTKRDADAFARSITGLVARSAEASETGEPETGNEGGS